MLAEQQPIDALQARAALAEALRVRDAHRAKLPGPICARALWRSPGAAALHCTALRRAAWPAARRGAAPARDRFGPSAKAPVFTGVLDGGTSAVFMQGTKLSQFMKSVEEVAGAMGEVEAEAEAAEPAAAAAAGEVVEAGEAPAMARDGEAAAAARDGTRPAAAAGFGAGEPAPVDSPAAVSADQAAADPWAAILEAGASLLQGLASARRENGASGGAPIAIEPDPVSGRPTLRLPLPEPAVLQRLAKAFEPWLR